MRLRDKAMFVVFVAITVRATFAANAAVHPNFLLNRTEINQLKTMITHAGYVQDNWMKVKSVADAAVTNTTYNYTSAANNSSGNNYTNPDGQAISALGMAYQMTGNMSYANKGAQILRAWVAATCPSGCQSFDGNMQQVVFALPFLYDMIYSSGALSAVDISSIETWFRNLASFQLASVEWNGGFWAPAWQPYRNVNRLYLAPEAQSNFLWIAAIGYLLGDSNLTNFGVDGDGYPHIWGDSTSPRGSQNPYSFKHMLHDIGYPDGTSIRMWARQGSFGYTQILLQDMEIVSEAAWHNGVDLWHYHDPETGFGLADMLNLQSRYVRDHIAYIFDRHFDERNLYELMYSHFKDDMSNAIVNYTGPLVNNGVAERNPSYESNQGNLDYLNIFGSALRMIAAFDRSNPSVTVTQPGSISSIPYEVSSATDGFQVTATPSTVAPNSPITVTIRAVNRSTGKTDTSFTSGNVKLWTTNGSPAFADYYASGCNHVPCATEWDSTKDPSVPAISFTAADAGIKTVTVYLRQGGVGESWRLEALADPPASYPYSDVGSAPVRGFSNPIFVETASATRIHH